MNVGCSLTKLPNHLMFETKQDMVDFVWIYLQDGPGRGVRKLGFTRAKTLAMTQGFVYYGEVRLVTEEVTCTCTPVVLFQNRGTCRCVASEPAINSVEARRTADTAASRSHARRIENGEPEEEEEQAPRPVFSMPNDYCGHVHSNEPLTRAQQEAVARELEAAARAELPITSAAHAAEVEEAEAEAEEEVEPEREFRVFVDVTELVREEYRVMATDEAEAREAYERGDGEHYNTEHQEYVESDFVRAEEV